MFNAIYLRVSTEEQAKKGYSLPDQLLQCTEKAKMLNELPIREYTDDVTGEILERPELMRLFDDIKRGVIKTVTVLHQDRLSRKLSIFLIIKEYLDKHGVQLVYVSTERSDSIEGQLQEHIGAAIAEYNKKKIVFETTRGRRSKAREGKVLRDFNSFGYDYDTEKKNLKINEYEGPIVYEIFERFVLKNESINRIAIDLTGRAVPTKKNKGVWHRQVIKQILEKWEVYSGTFHANKYNTDGMGLNKFRKKEDRIKQKLRPKNEWIPITIPAIIPKEWGPIIRGKMEENRKKYAGVKGVNGYICSRVLRCGVCGNTMSGTPATNWGTKVFIYTCHKNYSGAKNKGCGLRLYTSKIDIIVWDQVKEWVNDPAGIVAAIESQDSNGSHKIELERLEKEQAQIKKGKKELLDLIKKGIIDEDIEKALKELMDTEETLKANIEKIVEKLNDTSLMQLKREQIKEITKQYLDKDIDKMETIEKNELVRQLIKEVVVTKEEVKIYTY